MSKPLDKLKHHVTGAIERGEKKAITAVLETTPQIKCDCCKEWSDKIERNSKGYWICNKCWGL